MAIGTLNLSAGLITTIAQFLRINELQEGYRVSSVGFAKISRNIEVMLDLPLKNRNTNGDTFLESCKAEYERLIEQSPSIPTEVIRLFNRKFKKRHFAKPDLCDLHEVVIFKEVEKDPMEATHEKTLRNLIISKNK